MKMIQRTVNSVKLIPKESNNNNMTTATNNNNHYTFDRSKNKTKKQSRPKYHFGVLSWYLIGLLFGFYSFVSCGDVIALPNSGIAPTLPPPPHAAALASPGSGAGGLGASSILEQFTPNCTAVSHIFQGRGIDAAEIPAKPKNEMGLRYCESSSVGTCCTFSMETRMAAESRRLLEKHSKEHILRMTNNLALKAQKFNEVFINLLHESKKEFHTMFTRTYGVIYQQNSYVFSDLFNELESYYARGRVDLLKVMDKFFNTLYQKMFKVLNGQFSFDDKYLKCVSEYMKDLKPFGDVPDKLSNQIKRSFVATRTYGQALATAADVSKKLISVRFNPDCTAALTKMQNCGACKGYTEKPCVNYCVNVVKGCLHYFNELDVEWENFVMAMDKVAERLLGSFNIVMVVEPINIKISEAIMNFQDNGHDITNRVFQGCGRPSLGRARRSLNPKFNSFISSAFVTNNKPTLLNDLKVIRKRSAEENEFETDDILDIDATIDDSIVLREKRSGETDSQEKESSSGTRNNRRNNQNNQKRKQQQNRKNNDNDYTGRDPILDKLVRDIRQRVKDSKKFWSNLPHQICSNETISSQSDADGMCWNGHTIDRYMHSVTTEHGSNPEFPGNPSTPRQTSQVATQLYYLKNVISHLRNAYNGQDVDWSDQEEPYFGSGSGSGGGSDDEDDDEGSGLGSPFIPGHGKPDRVDHTSGRVNNVDDEDEEIDESEVPTSVTGGTFTTHTARPKPHPPHDTNDLDHNRIDENDNGEDEDDDEENHDGSKSSGGNSNVAKTQKMSLRQALLVYLLPLYMAWFGGVCAEML